MARPKVPLIRPAEVVAKALEIIDRDGLEGLSIRGIGAELGVNGASLYHHFRDKDAILDGVRLLIIRQNRVGEQAGEHEIWQSYLRRTTVGYRRSLLRHPNVAPLMAPTVLQRPYSLLLRDRVAEKLLHDGVPAHLVLPIIDAMETLAYASALLNPTQAQTQQRLAVHPEDHTPSLARAVRSAPRSADRLFDVQLDAFIDGWSAIVERDGTSRGSTDR